MLKVCLTGGIASGKSTASDKFLQLGVEVIDTDLLAREVVEEGTPGLQRLVECFGISILNRDGGLNRPLLRRLVFVSDSHRKQLNQILHPLIHQAVVDRLKQLNCSMVVVVIPLYEGQKQYDWFDRICVVDVSEDVQLQRLLLRDSIDETLAKQMIRSQVDRGQRLSLADDVVSNNDEKSGFLKRLSLLVDFYQRCLIV